MRQIFADAFFWIALTGIRDESHERAEEFLNSTDSYVLVTTEEVLIEYLNYYAASRLRREATTVVRNLRGDSQVRIVPQTITSFERGFRLYNSRPDKGYSLTDCISMSLMRVEGMTEVLTNDIHFEQEGFRAFFRSWR